MTVTFECPETGILDDYEDAYKGLKFKCKHCNNFHVLPSDSSVSKQLLVNCPNNEVIVSVAKSNNAHLFKCASCQETHEIPNVENIGSRVILKSTLQVKESRSTVIPSQRKTSPLRKTSSIKRKTGATKRKTLNRKTTLNRNQKFKDSYADTDLARPNNKSRKSNASFGSVLIYVLFFAALAGIGYLIYNNQSSIADESSLRKKMALASTAHNSTEFNKAVDIIFDVIATLEGNVSLQEKINITLIHQNKVMYIKHRDFVKNISKKYILIMNDRHIDEQGVKESIKKLLTEIYTLDGSSEQKKPVGYAISKIQDNLLNKIKMIKFKIIDRQIKNAKKGYSANYHQSMDLYDETFEFIETLHQDDQKILEQKHKNDFAFFNQKKELFNSAESTYQTAQDSRLMISSVLKELQKIHDKLYKADQSLKDIIANRIQKLNQRQKIYDARDIGTSPNKTNAEKHKSLLGFISLLKNEDYLAKKEAFIQLSNLTVSKSSTVQYIETSLEELNLLAKQIGNHLKKEGKVKGELDRNKFSIIFKRNKQTFSIGQINHNDKAHLSIQLNDTQIIYPKTLFINNVLFHMEHFQTLYNSLLLYDSNIRNNSLWFVPEDFLKIGFLSAIQTNDQNKSLLFNGKIYQLDVLNNLSIHSREVNNEIEVLNTEIKIKILSSKEPFVTKADLLERITILTSFPISKDTLNRQLNLINSNRITSNLNDVSLIKDIKLFQLNIKNTLTTTNTWFKGKGKTGIELHATVTATHQINIRLFDPITLFTTFAYQAMGQNNIFNDQPTFLFMSKYKGRQNDLPAVDPFTITTMHPALGPVANYNFFSKKISFSEDKWEKGMDVLNQYRDNENDSKIELPAHILQIISKKNLKILFTSGSYLSSAEYKNDPISTFSKWVTNNLPSNKIAPLINVFNMYFNTPEFQQTINEKVSKKFNNTSPKLQINFLIKLVLNQIGFLNVLIHKDDKILNLWKTKQKNKIFYFKNKSVHNLTSSDHLKNLREIFKRNIPQYISPFKLPVLFQNSVASTWIPTYIPGYLFSEKIKTREAKKILRNYKSYDLLQIEENIEQSEIKNSKIKNLLSYVGYIQKNNYAKAQIQLLAGLKQTKNNKTVIGQLELFDLQLKEQTPKSLIESSKKIFKALVSSNALEGESKNIKDIRNYLAIELIKYNQLPMVSGLIKPELSKKNNTISELTILANICDWAFYFLSNQKLLNTEYSKEILPIQVKVIKEIQKQLNDKVKSSQDLFLLNHIWFKINLSKQGWDKTLTQILEPINQNKIDITNIQKNEEQEKLSKINILNFKYLIAYTLREPKEKLKPEQKIHLIKRYIQSLENNIKSSRPTAESLLLYQALIFLKNLNDLSPEKIAQNIKKFSNILIKDTTLLKIISIQFDLTEKNKFGQILNKMQINKISKELFLKLIANISSKKKAKQFKQTLNIKN
ncbi:MAG: hypothetical protein COA79_04695 [Planctomycetota bacterium]|nr:MAG: hypothetical protein COA79_04695 [Planctomycetota bacterium]